jgi:hypothetical protein
MPLPIASTLHTAFLEVLRARVPLARAVFLPGALAALLTVVLQSSVSGERSNPVSHLIMLAFLVGSVAGLALVLIAISCHRLVRLGYDSLPTRWGVYWSKREFAFLARAFLIAMLSSIPSSVGILLSCT